MPDNELAGATALVTGASRGLGRGIATTLHTAGAHVVGVARHRAPLEEVRAALGESFTAIMPPPLRIPLDPAGPVRRKRPLTNHDESKEGESNAA